MEPQLLWDRLSVLLEDFFSLTSLLCWVKAFDLMKSGKLGSLWSVLWEGHCLALGCSCPLQSGSRIFTC